MQKVRIRKDIAFGWSVLTDGAAVALAGRNLRLEMITPRGRVLRVPFEVEGLNRIVFVYRGVDHESCGDYGLTLWENKGCDGQTVVDRVRAFRLVPVTELEGGVADDGTEVETVELEVSDLVQLRGADGVGVEKVEQVVTSEESGGVNVVRMTMTDGRSSDFRVRNGRAGESNLAVGEEFGGAGYADVTDVFEF